MAKLILHIGTPKTGTSALQSLFAHNRDLFARLGFEYPNLPDPTRLSTNINGGQLLNACLCQMDARETPQAASTWGGEWRETEEALLTAGDTVLLSEECIYFGSWSSKGQTYEARYAQFWKQLVSMLDNVGVDDIHVIIYLRRQDEYISSQWKQAAKAGRTDLGFEAFFRLPIWSFRMDYAAHIRCVEEALGPRGIITVRRYDKEGFAGGDIFHDFCEAAGISWDDAFAVPNKLTNLSISNDVAVALLPFKEAALHGSELRRMLVRDAREFSSREPSATGATLFSEEEFNELMERYAEGNKAIARQYFGEEELFSSEYTGRHVWVPDKQRIEAYRSYFARRIARYEKLAPLRRAYHATVLEAIRKGRFRPFQKGHGRH